MILAEFTKLYYPTFLCLFIWHFHIFPSIFAKEQKFVECSTKYETSIPNFHLNCSVAFTYDKFYFILPECSSFDFRSMTVRAPASFYNLTFVCNSNFPISFNVDFSDGIVLKSYLDMKWTRTFINFTDISTYSYNLHVSPPNLPSNREIGDVVKYTFFSVQYPSEKIAILWFSTTETPQLEKNIVYWMGGKSRAIDVTDEIIHIPCLSPFPLITINKEGKNGSVKLNNIFPKFGAVVLRNYIESSFGGLVMNISNGKTVEDFLGHYGCTALTFGGEPNDVPLYFSIVRPPNVTSSFEIYYNDHNASQTKAAAFVRSVNSYRSFGFETEFTYFDYYGLRFKVQCHSSQMNVTLAVQEYHNHTINLNVSLSAKRGIVTKYSAECITPVIEVDENMNLYCVDLSEQRILQTWSVLRRDLTEQMEAQWSGIPLFPFRYIPRSNYFQCQVYIYSKNVIFHQTACKNPIICKILGDQLLRTNLTVGQNNYCNSKNSVELCVKLKPLKQGIVHCSSYRGDNSPHDKEYQNVYFTGFDGIFYLGMEKDPPKDAIIRLDVTDENEQRIILANNPAIFKIHCEAHSFYFEEGLQILAEYENGRQEIIPKENISDTNETVRNLEDSHPFLSVFIQIYDTNVKKLVCASPRLSVLTTENYKHWDFVAVNITIYNAIAPTIDLKHSKVKYIETGDVDQGITCQANGLPRPTIHWTNKLGQEIKGDLIIDHLIYKILRFPVYNTSYEGEYICIATNIAGNVSEQFKVLTHYSSDVKLKIGHILLISFGFVSLILIFVATFVLYRRKVKRERLAEMDEIVGLLQGKCVNPYEFNADIAGPLHTPYNFENELEKHSFCIDSRKILGSGEFGIVFKGTIAKVENDVAFKTVKSTANMTHLKSLVSELKLMEYIGKHSNIVEFLGAYTQEIKRGIIYIAIEFCGLGSLESYLRSNKGRFMKCPILKSNFESESTISQVGENEFSNSDNHSIKSLLKWSLEISNAMEFLNLKKVVHGDLATRNVLLTVDWVAKLTDFGLSRKTYNSSEYVKKGKDPLPWRWLALESLQTNVFTVQTDVWAFGIVLWEIFSLGEIPYRGISHTIDFVTQLENGLRNPKPKYASIGLYEVMVSCWNPDADCRPSFGALAVLFRNSLSDDCYCVNVQDLQAEEAEIGTEYLNLVE